MKLYGFFLSSAAYRVRIALCLKGLQWETVPVHLGPDRDEQQRPEFLALNQQGLVPVLVDGPADHPSVLTQSLSIIEYLEELHPAPPLLPARPADRAYVRAIALAIACEIHPLNNKRVLRYLRGPLQASKDDKDDWYRHWIEQGLGQLEAQLRREPRVGHCAFGDEPGLAECCLVPQITNALRFGCELSAVPTLMRIYAHCMALEPFVHASPANQPDAQPELLGWL
jgi:maleylacetoacetate isomerase